MTVLPKIPESVISQVREEILDEGADNFVMSRAIPHAQQANEDAIMMLTELADLFYRGDEGFHMVRGALIMYEMFRRAHEAVPK